MTWNNPNDDSDKSKDFLSQQINQGGLPGQMPPVPPEQIQSMYASADQLLKMYDRSRRQNTRSVLLIILAAVVLPLVIGVVILVTVFGTMGDAIGELGGLMNTITNPGPETRTVSGDPAHYDPVQTLADVTSFAGADAELVGIRAYYVSSDGTLDLNASYTPAPRVEYEFLREVPRPADAPPVGAGGTTAGQWYEPITIEAYRPGQVRHVTQQGGGVSMEYSYTNQGLEKQVGDPTTRPSGAVVPLPTCSFAELWQVALQNDAPADAVAIIEYDAEGYSFNISGVTVLHFGADCALVK